MSQPGIILADEVRADSYEVAIELLVYADGFSKLELQGITLPRIFIWECHASVTATGLGGAIWITIASRILERFSSFSSTL